MNTEEIKALYETYQPQLAEELLWTHRDAQSIEALLWRQELITVNHILSLESFMSFAAFPTLIHHVYVEGDYEWVVMSEAGENIQDHPESELIKLPTITLKEVRRITEKLTTELNLLHDGVMDWTLSEEYQAKDPHGLLKKMNIDDIRTALVHHYLDDLGVCHPNGDGETYNKYVIPEEGDLLGYLLYRFSIQKEDDEMAKILEFWLEGVEALEEVYGVFDERFNRAEDKRVAGLFARYKEDNEEKAVVLFNEARQMKQEAIDKFYQENPVLIEE